MIPHDKIFGPITCTNSATTGTLLPCLRRGTIEKLRVVQLTGALDGFSYVLYNTVAACQADGTALSDCLDARLYQITPVLVVASAKDVYGTGTFPEDGISNLAMPFEVKDDQDGNPLAGTPTNAGQNIVIKIIPSGSATKTFGVAITIMDPMII